MESLDYAILQDLLYNIIPQFTGLAHDLYCETKDRFYLAFEVNLALLRTGCHSQGTDSKLRSLRMIAHLLESLVCDTAEVKASEYPKLDKLLRHPDRKKIRFSETKKGREDLIRNLQTYYPSICEESRETLESLVVADRQNEIPSRILEQANKLHEMLNRYWSCDCAVATRKVYLHLPTLCESNDSESTTFDLLFSASNVGDACQEGEILVRIPSSRVHFEESLLQTIGSSTTPITACEGRALTGEVTICGLIKRAKRGAARFSAEISGDSFVSTGKLGKRKHFIKPRCRPSELLVSDELSNVSKQDINKLAVILAHTLLHLYDDIEGPLYWLSPNWIHRNEHWKTPQWTKQIRFFEQGKLKPKLELQHPYLLAGINEPSCIIKPPFENLEDAIHQAPCVLALGMTLLEMQLRHLKLSVEPPNLAENDDGYDQCNVNTDFTILDELLEQYKTHLDPLFFRAIDACLNPNLNDHGKVRDFIYKEILIPLRLYEEVNRSPDQIQRQRDELRGNPPLAERQSSTTADQSTSQATDFCLCVGESARTETAQRKESEDCIAPFNSVRNRDMNSGPSIQTAGLYSAHSIVSEPHNDRFRLFDDQAVSESRNLRMLSEKWFERLQDLVHNLLPHPPTNTGRVKIAILDSGVDITHPTIVCNKQRIMAKRSFLMQDSPREQAKDMIGHGTHILGLLLKVAPYADIYVARITKSPEFDEFQSIAKAIRCAAREWEVDIISMSFGLRDTNNEVHQAINEAHNKKIIMFAAASNGGGNQRTAYPANTEEVICVNSTDGQGNMSPFNPIYDRTNTFSTLGQDVESSWPCSLGGPYQCKSGTSYATPIAAGLAAIVLDWARRKLPESESENLKKLHSRKGIDAVFELMMIERSKYKYLTLWELFDQTEGYICENILKVLRPLCV